MALDPAATSAVWGEGVGSGAARPALGAASPGVGALCAAGLALGAVLPRADHGQEQARAPPPARSTATPRDAQCEVRCLALLPAAWWPRRRDRTLARPLATTRPKPSARCGPTVPFLQARRRSTLARAGTAAPPTADTRRDRGDRRGHATGHGKGQAGPRVETERAVAWRLRPRRTRPQGSARRAGHATVAWRPLVAFGWDLLPGDGGYRAVRVENPSRPI
jgi:hypothetical protein